MGSLSTASHMAFRKVALSTIDNYQETLKAVELVVFGSSRLRSPLLYSIPRVNDSAHEEDAIASPFWILEVQKCHNKLLSVCNGFF